MPAESRSLTGVVAKIIGAGRDQARLSPDSIASAALKAIDPKNVAASLPLVALAAHLALRQIARGLLRKRFLEEPDEEDEDGSESEQSAHQDAAPEPLQADLF